MNSCIIHPKKSFWIPKRDSYILLAQGFQASERFCAAELLSLFEYWTNGILQGLEVQKEQALENLLYMPRTLRQIREALFGAYSRNIIRRSLEKLERAGYLSRRRNPNNAYDQIDQWRFNSRVVQAAIDSLWKKPCSNQDTPTPTGSNLNGFTPTTGSNLNFDPFKRNNLKNTVESVCVEGCGKCSQEEPEEQGKTPPHPDQRRPTASRPVSREDQFSPSGARSRKTTLEGFQRLWEVFPGVRYADGRQRGSKRKAQEVYSLLEYTDEQVMQILQNEVESRQRRKARGEWVPSNWPHLENWLLDLEQIEEELSQSQLQLNIPYTASAEAEGTPPPADQIYPSEFLLWYARAQEVGICTDDPPELLRQVYGDRPKVRIVKPQGWEVWTWEEAREAWPEPGGPSAQREPVTPDTPVTQENCLQTLKYLIRQFGEGRDALQVRQALQGMQELLQERDAVLQAVFLSWARSRAHLIEIETDETGAIAALKEAF